MKILEHIARLHPKNHRADRIEYPQLWYCWPNWTKRIRWVGQLKKWLCAKITRHEWSKTEWGYGGGKNVDRWCRWCGHCASMPLAESPPPSAEMKRLTKIIKHGETL